jgi:hypothetical protein
MGMSVALWQVDEGSGPAWKEPPGAPEEFSEDELDENGRLALDADFADVEAILEQLGLKAPWTEDEEQLESAHVQRLATRLVPLSWKGLLTKGLDVGALPHGQDTEAVQSAWERFRLFVIDAARSGNALASEIDD